MSVDSQERNRAMKIKCENCGNKVSDDEKKCPNCGYTLYDDIFGDIADEVETEMKNVSDFELHKIRKQIEVDNVKLSFSEFAEKYAKEHGKPISNGLCLISGAARISRRNYDRQLKKAYENYLRGLGYDI